MFKHIQLIYFIEESCTPRAAPANGALVPAGSNLIAHLGTLMITCDVGYTAVGDTDTTCESGAFTTDISATVCGELHACVYGFHHLEVWTRRILG